MTKVAIVVVVVAVVVVVDACCCVLHYSFVLACAFVVLRCVLLQSVLVCMCVRLTRHKDTAGAMGSEVEQRAERKEKKGNAPCIVTVAGVW